MVYIFAGTKQQSDDYIGAAGIDRKDTRYISFKWVIMGVALKPRVICVGTFMDRTDFDEIHERLQAVGAKFEYAPEVEAEARKGWHFVLRGGVLLISPEGTEYRPKADDAGCFVRFEAEAASEPK